MNRVVLPIHEKDEMGSASRNDRASTIIGVDLFCGAGGLTHGLLKGGIKIVSGIDIDPSCRFPYEANNPAEFLERDISSIDPGEIASYYKGADFTLLAGCAPCQPFSTYSRSGRSREYSSQWPLVSKFGQLVKAVQPDFVTMENVPQLSDHSVFEEFLACLRGYEIWHSSVECFTIGIPQTRKRLVLLASKHGKVLFSNSGQNFSENTVRKTIGHLPPLNAGEQSPDDPFHKACALSPLNISRIRASKPGGTWRDWETDLQAICHRKSSGSTYPSVYGRMEWDKPAPTITTQCFGFGNGRFGHPEQDRAISLREAAMLQTFPETYQFVPKGEFVKFDKMGRLIGNAVPVRLGEAIAHSFIEHAQKILR